MLAPLLTTSVASRVDQRYQKVATGWHRRRTEVNDSGCGRRREPGEMPTESRLTGRPPVASDVQVNALSLCGRWSDHGHGGSRRGGDMWCWIEVLQRRAQQDQA